MISAPHDYGLTPQQTLDHVVEDDPPDGFDAFWSEIREEVACLSTHFRGTIDAPVNRLWFESVRSVHIAARLTLPAGRPCGAVITVHGYGPPDDFEGGSESCEVWTEQGLATLRLRLRGFPPSTSEIDDLRAGWILHNIEAAGAWIAPRAVADVMQGYRCLRRHFGKGFPIGMHGVSLGAGLVVIAAAQMDLQDRDPPHRLVLEHPDFGDWAWRTGRYCNGPGGAVNDWMETLREEHGGMLRTLRLMDAALHGRRVGCPTLCKLAIRDEIVPAPSAAAVFNGLTGDEKWRFLTRFGHFEGGIADARRHASFAGLHSQFLIPGQKPSAAVDGIVGQYDSEMLY